MKNALLILAIIFSASCGKLTGEHTGANDISSSGLLGGISFVSLKDGKSLLSGTMGKNQSHSFRMRFSLPDGKSLRFFFYSNRTLESGVIATFTKSGNELFINFVLNGVSDTRSLGEFPDTIDLVLDIHNDHEDAHLLLWKNSGPYGDSEGCVEDNSCLYNSEFYTFPNDGPWGSQGKAPGSFWGVQGDHTLILFLEGPREAMSDA